MCSHQEWNNPTDFGSLTSHSSRFGFTLTLGQHMRREIINPSSSVQVVPFWLKLCHCILYNVASYTSFKKKYVGTLDAHDRGYVDIYDKGGLAHSSGNPKTSVDPPDVAFLYCGSTFLHNPSLAMQWPPTEVTASTSKWILKLAPPCACIIIPTQCNPLAMISHIMMYFFRLEMLSF